MPDHISTRRVSWSNSLVHRSKHTTSSCEVTVRYLWKDISVPPIPRSAVCLSESWRCRGTKYYRTRQIEGTPSSAELTQTGPNACDSMCNRKPGARRLIIVLRSTKRNLDWSVAMATLPFSGGRKNYFAEKCTTPEPHRELSAGLEIFR